jgi:hypothetical protein
MALIGTLLAWVELEYEELLEDDELAVGAVLFSAWPCAKTLADRMNMKMLARSKANRMRFICSSNVYFSRILFVRSYLQYIDGQTYRQQDNELFISKDIKYKKLSY